MPFTKNSKTRVSWKGENNAKCVYARTLMSVMHNNHYTSNTDCTEAAGDHSNDAITGRNYTDTCKIWKRLFDTNEKNINRISSNRKSYCTTGRPELWPLASIVWQRGH